MITARVFKSGNSQAIRLPKEFRVEERELEILRDGDDIILRPPKGGNIARAFMALASLPDDFPSERDQEPPQVREGL